MSTKKSKNESVQIQSTLSSSRVAACPMPMIPDLNKNSCDVLEECQESTNEKLIGKPVTSKFEQDTNEKRGDRICETGDQENQTIDGATKCPERSTEKSEFSEPKLLTSLKIIESLHSLGENCSQNKVSSSKDPTIPKKAASKLNVPFDEKIYKNLIDLHIRDEDLGLPNLPLKPKEITRVRDPEPVLSDYYKPKFDKEYVFKAPRPTYKMDTFRMPELTSVYEISKRWEVENEPI